MKASYKRPTERAMNSRNYSGIQWRLRGRMKCRKCRYSKKFKRIYKRFNVFSQRLRSKGSSDASFKYLERLRICAHKAEEKNNHTEVKEILSAIESLLQESGV